MCIAAIRKVIIFNTTSIYIFTYNTIIIKCYFDVWAYSAVWSLCIPDQSDVTQFANCGFIRP